MQLRRTRNRQTLAIRAVARVDGLRRLGDLVADRPALAPAGLWELHASLPSRSSGRNFCDNRIGYLYPLLQAGLVPANAASDVRISLRFRRGKGLLSPELSRKCLPR